MTPAQRQQRRRSVQQKIEWLSRVARAGAPLTAKQNRELDQLMRELNELDAADFTAPPGPPGGE